MPFSKLMMNEIEKAMHAYMHTSFTLLLFCCIIHSTIQFLNFSNLKYLPYLTLETNKGGFFFNYRSYRKIILSYTHIEFFAIMYLALSIDILI